MIQAVRGTKDMLPVNSLNWQYIENKFRETSSSFGYEEIRTPIFEKTEVFARSIGEETDIVNKEMYSFTDKGGESLTLRPEQTAALVRAVVENSLLQQQSQLRLWYFGPYFRYERPQKGRLRQFHQYGAECIGSYNPEADVEVILLADAMIRAIGIKEYTLIINSLGTSGSREEYKKALIEFLLKHKDKLSYDSQRRLETNPLRVLDSKDDADIAILENAPSIIDYLDQESTQHFSVVKDMLDFAGVKYQIQPKLVRGLDYYCHTVFEFQNNALGSQNSLGGGGRYNDLIEELGGKPTPAVGFAFGVERLLLALEALNTLPEAQSKSDIFVITLNPELNKYALKIANDLRKIGYKVSGDLNRRSMKAQFREANKINAKYSIVLGDDEIQQNSVIIKNMNDGSQETVKIEDLNSYTF